MTRSRGIIRPMSGRQRPPICTLMLVTFMACAGQGDVVTPLSQSRTSTSPPTTSTSPSTTSTAAAATTTTQYASPAITASIEVTGGPFDLAIAAENLWIERHRHDGLSRLDPGTLTIEEVADVSVHCSVEAAAGAIWTANAHTSILTKVDPATAAALATYRITDVCGVAGTDTRIWVVSPGEPISIIRELDPNNGEELATIEVPELSFGLSLDDDVLWAVGEGGGGWLAKIDPHRAEVVSLQDTGRYYDGLVPGFGALWAVSRAESFLRRLNRETGEVETQIDVGASPNSITVAYDSIWVVRLTGDLVRVDPITNTVVADEHLLDVVGNTLPFTAYIAPLGGSLWISALERGLVVQVDPKKVASTSP